MWWWLWCHVGYVRSGYRGDCGGGHGSGGCGGCFDGGWTLEWR